MERQTERVARLVDQLLDVTRMAQRRLSLDLQNVDLTALVREVVAQFDLELKRARCEVALVVDDPEGVD
ncbi:hypothetical protein, partial [Salmonella sp. SAL4358]|uniref:hypothetical protein n=1 Tax=Salmonella sp. SAL4358 TaxID=3159879 RepID=UPI00397AA1A8